MLRRPGSTTSRHRVQPRAASVREQIDAVVDRAHELALGARAEILDPPQEFHHEPGYYAVFFRDPDGFTLEVVRQVESISSTSRRGAAPCRRWSPIASGSSTASREPSRCRRSAVRSRTDHDEDLGSHRAADAIRVTSRRGSDPAGPRVAVPARQSTRRSRARAPVTVAAPARQSTRRSRARAPVTGRDRGHFYVFAG